jgi:electron transport complex protein RnfB
MKGPPAAWPSADRALGMSVSAEQIDTLLPQTQCTRCGYQGCRPYAEAIARGEALINRCPPGGSETIVQLAALLDVAPLALDSECGREEPAKIAYIDSERCIGCARCLPPCPVDAIVGASRQLHTVIDALCTGCELCIAPCPVDCITLVPRQPPLHEREPSPAENRHRFLAHQTRLQNREQRRQALLAARKHARPKDTTGADVP